MKIVTVVGARPQFVKAAPLSKALRKHHREILVHTGQHYDPLLSEVFFEELELPKPDYHLGAGSGSHGVQTAKMLEGIEAVLLGEKPTLALVYGDTNSTLAGALAAAKLSIPIVHVEAGLRSFNRQMPEEINRIMADHLSSLLFCPTDEAVTNLKREGIERGVHKVGDIMYDAVLTYFPVAQEKSRVLERLGLSPRAYCAATIHRKENTDSPKAMEQILKALAQLDLPVVLPLHPRARHFIQQWGLEPLLHAPNLKVTEPLPYLDMLNLTGSAAVVLTDSGGLQKEAYMLKVPCLTIRGETEWVETVKHGWNRLAAADDRSILEAYASIGVPDRHPPIFGDGRSADSMCEHIETFAESL
ncbi:UDP-N-acetylglucosamine 2-epimerase (non-hydrolyzing) [Paenibacillus nanensis]|uniref:UDP-N-acetylglucosamine 2-epimerase (Non-hydrolyzing) n=1 Tax=Paenibacillus nanensis TaxID=393251 RepID=A0A3A1UVC8_9BACL|nr:UDP-N-acetylglucosamine 2-epimerase (non-hydrolyzing) [Paenibacillus nanensis]RIX52457.1 UDP-N-acetylglucosamine 2-epimerase (non-hydrolyzing) [Paenibacillus nanensis]